MSRTNNIRVTNAASLRFRLEPTIVEERTHYPRKNPDCHRPNSCFLPSCLKKAYSIPLVVYSERFHSKNNNNDDTVSKLRAPSRHLLENMDINLNECPTYEWTSRSVSPVLAFFISRLGSSWGDARPVGWAGSKMLNTKWSILKIQE
jgi:hypothetical protein